MNTPDISGLSDFRFSRESTFYTIWMARQDSLGRDVEVHQWSQSLTSDQAAHQMRMVRSIAKMSHPSIPAILDVNPSAVPPYFIVEHTAAPSLSDMIEKNGVFAQKDALAIAGKIVESLAYVGTQAPMVVRNLKPQNIHLEENGVVRLTDFSLAIIANDPADGPVVDGDDIVGTPNFVSPEHADGKLDVDQRSDMYSLGALLYYLTTRKVPFDCDDVMKTLELQKVGQLPTPRDYNPALTAQFVAFISHLMMKNPQYRYATWSDVLADIRRLQANRPLANSAMPPDAVSSILVRRATSNGTSQATEADKSIAVNKQRKHPLAWAVLIIWLAWLANCRLSNPLGLPENLAPNFSIPVLDNLVGEKQTTPASSVTSKAAEQSDELQPKQIESKHDTAAPAAVDETVSVAQTANPPAAVSDTHSIAYDEIAKQIGGFLRNGDVKSAYDLCARINSIVANDVVNLLEDFQSFDTAAADAILKYRCATTEIIYMGKRREVEPIKYAGTALTVKFKDASGAVREIQMDMSKIDEAQKLDFVDKAAATEKEHAVAAIMALKFGDKAVFARHAPKSGTLAKIFERMN